MCPQRQNLIRDPGFPHRKKDSYEGQYLWRFFAYFFCNNSCWNILLMSDKKKVMYKAFLEFSKAWGCICTKANRSTEKLQTCLFTLREMWNISNLSPSQRDFISRLLLLPVTRSQTEPVYSTHSDEPWSSRSQALGCCFYASTSASGSSGTPPMLTSRWTNLQQGLLGREMRPMTPLDRAGHLKREDKRITWSGFSNCWVSVSFF